MNEEEQLPDWVHPPDNTISVNPMNVTSHPTYSNMPTAKMVVVPNLSEQHLERIATALEEANRLTSAWIATNAQWHEEVEDLNAARYQEQAERENRLVALHERNAQRDEAWRKEQTARMNEQFQQTYDAWFEHFKKERHDE